MKAVQSKVFARMKLNMMKDHLKVKKILRSARNVTVVGRNDDDGVVFVVVPVVVVVHNP